MKFPRRVCRRRGADFPEWSSENVNTERTADGGAEGQPTKETETLPLQREAEQEISREGSKFRKERKVNQVKSC